VQLVAHPAPDAGPRARVGFARERLEGKARFGLLSGVAVEAGVLQQRQDVAREVDVVAARRMCKCRQRGERGRGRKRERARDPPAPPSRSDTPDPKFMVARD